MIDIQEATLIGVDLVLSKSKHPDYDHVVKLSEELYKPLATGKGIEKLMRRYDPREDEAAFKQRVAITQHTTPSTWNTLMNPVRKLESVRPVVDRMEWNPENAAAAEKVGAVVGKFRGAKTLDHYITGLSDAAELDPNAFELIVFDPFDPRMEVPKPYAVHVAARDAWNFEYFNDELQWLFIHRTIKYILLDNDGTGKPVMRDGHRFVLYSADHHIVFEQVRPDLATAVKDGKMGTEDGSPVTSPVFGAEGYFLRVSSNELYRVTFYEQKSGRVPAFRLGARLDPDTDYRTCINTLHAGIPWLMKMVKYVSEMDLTVCLHVFPKKWQYAPKCTADGCNSGKLPSGTQCGQCKGTGRQPVIGSAQEVNTLAMPDNPAEMFDLTKMVFYEPTDVAVIQELRAINDDCRENAVRAVYASDMYTKDQVNVTATAKAQELDSAYAALRPLVRKREETKPYLVHVIAAYLDAEENMTATTVLPQNLRYETEGDVVALMKESAPVAGRSYMASKALDLIHRSYTDDPEALKKALAQERLNPFSGMGSAEVTSLISGGLPSKESVTMWVEWDTIWDTAETEHKGEAAFYDMAPDKIKAAVYAIRDRMIAEKEAKAQEAQNATLGMDPNQVDSEGNPIDPNADPQAQAA